MGALRFSLAFSVVNIHAKIFGRFLIGGDTAVQMFFIISGFYMAMVLNEKYMPGRATNIDFWKSRALRIFPAYYIVLLATVIVGGGYVFFSDGHLQPFDAWNQLLIAGQSIAHVIFLSVTQMTLLGLDTLNFVTLDRQREWSFTADFWQDNFPVWRSLFVPQAWTLSLELYFYLLAPFLVRRSFSVLLWICLASVFLRVLAAILFGFRLDPWSYRFFPFELLFFLSGVIAYRLGKLHAAPGALNIAGVRCLVAILIFCAGAMGRFSMPGRTWLLASGLMALLFLTISSLFELTKWSRADRLLGELSYPLYICHVLIVWMVGAALSPGSRWSRILVPLLSVGAAATIYWCIDRRVDEFRHRRFSAPQPVV